MYGSVSVCDTLYLTSIKTKVYYKSVINNK